MQARPVRRPGRRLPFLSGSILRREGLDTRREKRGDRRRTSGGGVCFSPRRSPSPGRGANPVSPASSLSPLRQISPISPFVLFLPLLKSVPLFPLYHRKTEELFKLGGPGWFRRRTGSRGMEKNSTTANHVIHILVAKRRQSLSKKQDWFLKKSFCAYSQDAVPRGRTI